MRKRVLVIRLGALGDIVLHMAAFASIRAHHPDAEIVFQTKSAFAVLGLMMPWFDRVILDDRPKAWQIGKWIKLVREVRACAPEIVYDFHGKTRQSILFHLAGRPKWSGAIKGSTFGRPSRKEGMHCTDVIEAQLEAAGVPYNPDPNLSWLDDAMKDFDLPENFAVIIPGCSPQHPHKRWPADSYAELAQKLAVQGIATIAVGGKDDQSAVDCIRALAPDVMDLCGKTNLKQLAALARRAKIVIGNDTGPTHIAAVVGAPTIGLMSEKVDPVWSAPKGPRASWLQGKPIASLSVDEVYNRAVMELATG